MKQNLDDLKQKGLLHLEAGLVLSDDDVPGYSSGSIVLCSAEAVICAGSASKAKS